ncbi:MAG: hypothetical protein M3162_04610 [Thermoproteota archaeon]|nr:hypothetical protein [Thermoproteota archaeon]
MQGYRPFGVTIIAILAVLGGIGSLLIGLIVLIVPILGIIFGGFLIIIGLAYFAVAYGLWNGLSWAWVLTILVSALGIVAGLATIIVGTGGSLLYIIVNAVIIYYLFRSDVKAYFGRG